MTYDAAFWAAIAADEYKPPRGQPLQPLIDHLLGLLGSPDPAQRDGLAYTMLAQWTASGILTAHHHRHIIAVTLGNLTHGIGSQGDNSVILRSFSALILSVSLWHEARAPFLSADELSHIVEASLRYFREERDQRGYVEGLGWLHSVAHTADILKFAARGPHATPGLLQAMLDAIRDKLLTPTTTIWVFGEDERLAMAIIEILKRALLPEQATSDFVSGLPPAVKALPQGEDLILDVFARHMNIKSLLRALYFRLLFAEASPTLRDTIAEALQSLG